MPDLKKVDIYTDGACSGNPGPGGWGAILIYKGIEKEIAGFNENTTNNRMELLAAIEAMNCLKEHCAVSLYSDSAYMVNGFNLGWVYNWKNKGWKRDKDKEVINVELWQALYALTKKHDVTFIKVKGHSDNEYNNRCDKLATDQIKIHTNGK